MVKIPARGFTLIELLVVLAILALLLTIASPRYIHHVDRARDASLRSSLKVMREAIDKFEGDQGRLPASLHELVERDYLRSIPPDPITERSDSWVTFSRLEVQAARLEHGISDAGRSPNPSEAGARPPEGIADVRSGAEGRGEDGTPYKDW
jgi:general secretion pathway protein G